MCGHAGIERGRERDKEREREIDKERERERERGERKREKENEEQRDRMGETECGRNIKIVWQRFVTVIVFRAPVYSSQAGTGSRLKTQIDRSV